MLTNVKILLVGCGAMGSALLQGWITAKIANFQFTVVTPHAASVLPFQSQAEVVWAPRPEELPAEYKPDIVVLAVKPQIINNDLLRHYYEYVLKGALFITVAAGREISSFRTALGEIPTIVRAMPNLPAAFGKGMTVGYAEKTVPAKHLTLVNTLFAAVGKIIWVDRESLFHPVTAVSGSGPAYLYLLVESLTFAAIQAGIGQEQAEILARQTMIGAANLLEHTKDSADVLKARVTSPGGITESALKILETPEAGLKELMTLAIAQGVNRSKELGHD